MRGLRRTAGFALSAVCLAVAPASASAAGGTVDASCSPGLGGGFAAVHFNTTWAQTFTPTRSGKLLTADIRNYSRSPGGSGGPVDVKLYATSGGVPVHPAIASTQIPGTTIIADSAYRTYSADFDPSTALFLSQGTEYALGVSTGDNVQNVWGVGVNTCPGTIYRDFGADFQKFAFTSDEDFGFLIALGPANDDFARAETLHGSSSSVGGTTAGGTRETNEPDHLTIPPDANLWVGDHSVWYEWTAPGSGTTTIDVCTAAIDSIVAVYSLGGSGSSFADLTRVTDNNNGADDSNCPGGTFGSYATFQAVGGTTYRIAVGDAGGARESTFTIALAGPGDDPPAITPINPAPGSKTTKRKPKIKASVTDATQLDDAFMTITVDGNDRNLIYDPNTDVVSAKSQKLKPGRHTATVTASEGGLDAESSWNFKVKKKRR